ncbi:hypothetical protein CNEO4_2680001 [Clostridium neonatale]|nr:hypothetical protein CNEO4_2680001 [Clostridium neonatale]
MHTGIMPNRGSLDKVLSLNETFNLPAGYYRGGKVTQNIPNNGAINASLNCGQSKDIPAGYTNGGRITANSLASQTPANADASTIIAGRNAWVNGNLINGIAEKRQYNNGNLGSTSLDKTNGVTINCGFLPTIVVAYIVLNGSTGVNIKSDTIGDFSSNGLYKITLTSNGFNIASNTSYTYNVSSINYIAYR